MNGLEIIKDASILTEKDFFELAGLKAELSNTVETAPRFRTKTLMRVSTTNDEKCPTWDAKYWQAVSEQNTMFMALVMLSYEYRKNALEIRKLKRQWGAETDDIEQELIQVEIEKKTFLGMDMELTAKHRIREILEWSKIKAELLPMLKYGDQDVDAHQLEAMTLRWENQAALVNEHTPVADARNILGIAKMTRSLQK